MIKVIVACSINGVIGRQGSLPWHLPGDLRRFSSLTTGNVVVMGRKTYESLPDKYRPLPDRVNIVLTRSGKQFDGAKTAASLDEVLWVAAKYGGHIYIAGGEEVYREYVGIADEVLMTLVEDAVDGDSYFLPLDDEVWVCTDRGQLHFENRHEFRYLTYERR